MSSIDSPDIIRKLIERNGCEPAFTFQGKRSIPHPRRTTEQIWAYITGFGGPCFKLIYGMYPDGMKDQEATGIFLKTANIKPGTTPTCLFHSGKLTEAGKLWWRSMWGQLPMPEQAIPFCQSHGPDSDCSCL